MVRGSLYINQTYGFQMFRAPDWQPSIAARAALPNAIAALGTSDQSTLLIIGRDRAHDSLDAQSAATEKAVEEIYENYRPMPPQRITVAGVPAIERQFRGEAEPSRLVGDPGDAGARRRCVHDPGDDRRELRTRSDSGKRDLQSDWQSSIHGPRRARCSPHLGNFHSDFVIPRGAVRPLA